jgi:hypothetical protein
MVKIRFYFYLYSLTKTLHFPVDLQEQLDRIVNAIVLEQATFLNKQEYC